MKKIMKNMAAMSLTTMMVFNSSIMNTYAMTGGNTADNTIKIYFSGNDDVTTESRKKNNATPVYVKNTNSAHDFRVGTVVANTKKGSRQFKCDIGEEIFINSKGVKGESVFLKISMPAGNGWIEGKWSPDSVNYKNVLK